MAGHPAKTQVEHQYTMLAKTRVNNLDGGGWDMDEKDLQAGTRRWSIDKRGAFGFVARGRQSECQRGSRGKRLRAFSGFGVRDVVLKKFLGLYPGANQSEFL
jgi:hypothetical protein